MAKILYTLVATVCVGIALTQAGELTQAQADARCNYNRTGFKADIALNGEVRCRKVVEEETCFPNWWNANANGGVGQFECCPGDTKMQQDEKTGVTACCVAGQTISVCAVSKTGACCDAGNQWSYNSGTKHGVCCPFGQGFNGYKCVNATPNPPTPSLVPHKNTWHIKDCDVTCPSPTIPTELCPSPHPTINLTQDWSHGSLWGTGRECATDFEMKPFENCANVLGKYCRGMEMRTWWANPVVVPKGKAAVDVPVIGNEWSTGGQRKTAEEFRFPVDTWFSIAAYSIAELQGKVAVYVDGHFVGETSDLSTGAVTDLNGQWDACFKDNSHSNGIFRIPAGSNKVSLKHVDGANDLIYFVIRYDAICSQRNPCLGEQILDWTWFGVTPLGNSNLSSWYSSQRFDYDYNTILTIVDTEFATEQYTVFIDGKVLGRTFGPEWMGDDFAGAGIHSLLIPAHSFAWGAYWGSYKIPKGEHVVEWRKTRSQDIGLNGLPMKAYNAEYRVDRECDCHK
ncbi:hypothetical protein N431DRAFT_557249 [Stipitochalara longipes BDJ]|nr:hypothetical protein N431DRAFT_557249 [Stipitochalara longipes BDJ]